MKKSAVALTAFCLAVVIQFCGKSDPREPVFKLLDSLTEAARQRDAAKIGSFLADAYTDLEGNDRDSLVAMVADWFLFYPQAGVKVLGRRAAIFENGLRAEAECDLSLKAEVGGFSLPVPGMGETWIRVRLELKQSGESWLVSYAEWREVGAGELLAESLKLIPKKSF